MSLQREQMWECFHWIRTSQSYITLWEKLLKEFVGIEPLQTFYQQVRSYITLWEKLLKEFVGIEPLQTFYQQVTDQIFQEMIQQHFPVTATDVPGSAEK